MKIKGNCKTCGADIIFWPSENRRFCSKRCAATGSNNSAFGTKRPLEVRNKISEGLKGNIPWNKGLTAQTHKSIKQYIDKQKGQKRIVRFTKEGLERMRKATRLKNLTNNPMWKEEARKKLSETQKEQYKNGRVTWNKGLPGLYIAGDKHPNWKGDDYLRTDYRGPNWRFLRVQILERDNYTCQHCGATDRLVVHHIELYSINKNNNPRNLITLCMPCHWKVHFANGKGK
jgi:hypothetical protein